MSFVSPPDVDLMKDEARRLVIDGSASLEIGIVRANGEQRLVEIRSGLARIDASCVGISVLRDTTERKAADAALRRSPGWKPQ